MSIPVAVAIIAAAASLFGALLGGYLQMRSTEHQIRYTTLHEHRSEVLSRTYALVYEAQMALQRWIVPFSGYDRGQQIKEVARSYNELVDYYYPHALWLEKDTRNTLETLIASMKSVFEDFRVLPGSGDSSAWRTWNEPPAEQMGEIRHAVTMRVLRDIPALRTRLDGEFQAMLYPERRSWWRRLLGQ